MRILITNDDGVYSPGIAEGTDRWAIEQGYVSLMPLSLDLTDHAALSRVQQLDAWKQLKFA